MIDKRRHTRVPLAGAAIVDREGATTLGAFRVINLSAGGVLLDGNLSCRVGDELDIELRLPPHPPVSARAILVRQGSTPLGQRAALSFLESSPAAQRSIEAAVETAVVDASAAPVLIVDPDVDSYYPLREELGDLGQRTIVVGTAAEAMNLLSRPNQIAVAIVDCGGNLRRGLEIIHTLAKHHPTVRRVIMSGDIPAAVVDCARRFFAGMSVDDVLPKPWTSSDLKRVLGSDDREQSPR